MAGVKKQTLQEFNDSILALLECPVCLKYMESPIRQCKNSHSICSQCATQMATCPTCRGEIIDMRCLPLEHLTERVLLRCEFADSGCSNQQLMKDMPAHVLVCPYRSYMCPLYGFDCNWKGKRSDIYAHVGVLHEDFRLACGDDGIVGKTLEDLDFGTEFDECYVISYAGECFWLREACRPDAGKFFVMVQYIGPVITASNFTYVVDLSGTRVRYLHQTTTHCDTETVNDIVASGNCACVSIPILQSLVEEDSFKYEIQIKGSSA
ncbi:E3 ubiquitin-protein ligase Siah1-like [Bacillus rossius redtenbacheri]|uniref:E3 ubiquitin-protein ligase Siah1-like n=1 Tax=Bacillus rossius redtenbacheri TaxID=93214 RepID=UPI002FDDB6FC